MTSENVFQTKGVMNRSPFNFFWKNHRKMQYIQILFHGPIKENKNGKLYILLNLIYLITNTFSVILRFENIISRFSILLKTE